MENQVFTPGNKLQMECLWFCSSSIIQEGRSEYVWLQTLEHPLHSKINTVHDTDSCRPDEIFYLPKFQYIWGRIFRITFPHRNVITSEETTSMWRNRRMMAISLVGSFGLLATCSINEHQEYFEYVVSAAVLWQPKNWEALDLYHELQFYAIDWLRRVDQDSGSLSSCDGYSESPAGDGTVPSTTHWRHIC